MTSPFIKPQVVVSTEVFEGPLDLLVNLIERRQLFISDISIKKVTTDYLNYIQSREVFPVEEGSHFIFTASILVLMKSRSLLPEIELSDEEEEDIDSLKDRLEVYQLIKNKGEEIESLFNRAAGFKRRQLKVYPRVFSPDEKTSLNTLLEAVAQLLDQPDSTELNIPQAEVRTAIKLEEVMKSLSHRIQSNLKLRFSEFTGYRNGGGGDRVSRIETVLSFIALLELVRKGLMLATQRENDIEMEVANLETPRYH